LLPKLSDYQKIIEAAQDGKLVLFVGNGVSRLLGYPSWIDMGKKAIDVLHAEGHIEYAEKESLYGLSPKMQLSIYCDNCEAKKISCDYTKLISKDKTNDTNAQIYNALYSIGTVFVTTNYDDCLDAIAEKTTINLVEGGPMDLSGVNTVSPVKVFFKKEDLTSAHLDQLGTVLHLHGSVKDNASMVVTTRDYLEHYMDPFVIKFLNDLFLRKVVLFVGYGLEDEEILEYVVRKSNNQLTQEPRHFWLYPRLSRDNASVRHLDRYFARHCNVRLIDFNIDKLGHKHLEEVIVMWASELKDKVRKPNFEDEKSVIKKFIK
jgi:hypothetical protein